MAMVFLGRGRGVRAQATHCPDASSLSVKHKSLVEAW